MTHSHHCRVHTRETLPQSPAWVQGIHQKTRLGPPSIYQQEIEEDRGRKPGPMAEQGRCLLWIKSTQSTQTGLLWIEMVRWLQAWPPHVVRLKGVENIKRWKEDHKNTIFWVWHIHCNHDLTVAEVACSEPVQDGICQQLLMDGGGSYEVHPSLLNYWWLTDSQGEGTITKRTPIGNRAGAPVEFVPVVTQMSQIKLGVP